MVRGDTHELYNCRENNNRTQEHFAIYGLPTQVITDNGAQITSQEFEEFLKSNGIQH